MIFETWGGHLLTRQYELFFAVSHRTWEALALGSIPIVRKSSISPLFKNLPVIEISNWTEITSVFLQQQWLLLKHHLRREPLYLDYWIKNIKAAQKA